MPIIDEKGRLFGTINVVDALAVLLVLAVALAGVTLVTGGPEGSLETRYVTLDMGSQPEYVLQQFDEGDSASLPNTRGNLTITDTYFTPSESGGAALARVAVRGIEIEESFTYNGLPLQLGRTLRFETDDYILNGTIQNVGNRTDLPTQTRTVVLRGTVPNDVARLVQAGDTTSIADQTVASVSEVIVYDTNKSGQRGLYLTADLQTFGSGEAAAFDDTRVESGQTLTLPLSGYQFNATIDLVGGNLSRTTESVIVSDVVDAETARDMSTGDTYEVADNRLATVRNVSAYGTDNPDRKRVYVGLSLTALGHREEAQFGRLTVEEGVTIPFETSSYEFDGRIIRDGRSDLGVTTEEVLVTSVVDSRVAERIEAGDQYRVGGKPIATVENVAVYGTDEPDQKRIYVGLAVEALRIGELPEFGRNRPLREGVTLPFRTNTYEFDGEIVRLGRLVETGDATERTVELQLKNVPPERANSVEVGMTETNAGQTVAEGTGIEVQPAIVTLTSDSGNIYEREHPVNKTVTLTVDLQVREEETGIRFKGQTMQEGNVVILDLGTTTIRATVTDLDPE